MSLSLYLHIPFCAHRCTYCDFNTYTTLEGLQPAYATALAAEVRQMAGSEPRPAHTVFFGGGTPSLMSAGQLAEIMGAVRETFALSADSEITLEANPETVDRPYLADLRRLGFNRLSFGAQSAVPAELALLGRTHDFACVAQALDTARATGFDNCNLDLIYGLPGQEVSAWERSLRAVLALRPEHLSLYCLTIEPGTPLQRQLLTGQIIPPDPDLAAEQYELACAVLGAAGYDHYEISNWALPGRRCEHNLTYWRNGSYPGLGAGAHGHVDGWRYHVVRQPRVYLRRIAEGGGSWPLSSAVAGKQRLSREERIGDTMITQLRLLDEGVNVAAFSAEFGLTPAAQFGDTLTRLIGWELLEERDGWLRLTERGRFLSNQVFHRLV